MCNTVYCGLINININTDVQENVQIGCTGYVHIAAVWMMENNTHLHTHLVVFDVVWACWWRRCGGTWGCCRGAALPPGRVAWCLRCEYPLGEFWAGCWQEPVQDNTIPPDEYCQLPTVVKKYTKTTNKQINASYNKRLSNFCVLN